MATQVESRYCKKCQTKYRTKVRKGRDTKSCPGCRHLQRLGISDNQPNPTAKDSALNFAS